MQTDANSLIQTECVSKCAGDAACISLCQIKRDFSQPHVTKAPQMAERTGFGTNFLQQPAEDLAAKCALKDCGSECEALYEVGSEQYSQCVNNRADCVLGNARRVADSACEPYFAAGGASSSLSAK